MKNALVALLTLFAVAACSTAGTTNYSLAPMPFELKLPSKIAAHLSNGPLEGPWAEEAARAGVTAATTVYYQPDQGNRTILMSVYYFPADKFDAAQNPNEPPPFGKEVIRADGQVLSVAGPQDTIYDAETQDGRNVVATNGIIYDPAQYSKTQ